MRKPALGSGRLARALRSCPTVRAKFDAGIGPCPRSNGAYKQLARLVVDWPSRQALTELMIAVQSVTVARRLVFSRLL